MSKLSKKELFDTLLEYKYIIFKDGAVVVTEDFYRDFGSVPKAETKELITQKAQAPIVAPSAGIISAVNLEKTPESILTKFIVEAKVPARGNTKSGSYAINKHNDKAEKVLIKALKSGVNYDVLKIATALYYKSGVMYKTIANFFLEGIWKDEYNTLVDNIGEGTLEEYLSKSINEGKVAEQGASRFRRR